jgi:hypothetical protein
MSMASQLSDLETRRRVENADFVVAATAHNPPAVEFHARNSLVVGGDCLGTDLLRPVPNLDVAISRYGNNSLVADLNRVDSRAMAIEATDQGKGRLDGEFLR